VIQTVADDETVLDREADVIDLDGHLSPRGLVQEACGRQRSRIPRAQDVLQIEQRLPAIHDILHDDDVPPFDRHVQIADQADLARRRSALRVACEGNEIERQVTWHLPDQVRQEYEGSFEHRHQVESVGEVAPQFPRELGDALLNLVVRE